MPRIFKGASLLYQAQELLKLLCLTFLGNEAQVPDSRTKKPSHHLSFTPFLYIIEIPMPLKVVLAFFRRDALIEHKPQNADFESFNPLPRISVFPTGQNLGKWYFDRLNSFQSPSED